MKILLTDNKSYDLEFVPDEIDDLRYCVLDYSNPRDPDYIFMPLVFIEIFNAPAAVVQIGDKQIKVPIDWNVIICDPEAGDPELLPLTSLNDRGFSTVTINPITSFMPDIQPIKITQVYNDVKWHFPKLQTGHILVVPMSDDDNPACALFVKDTAKIPDQFDIGDLY